MLIDFYETWNERYDIMQNPKTEICKFLQRKIKSLAHTRK